MSNRLEREISRIDENLQLVTEDREKYAESLVDPDKNIFPLRKIVKEKSVSVLIQPSVKIDIPPRRRSANSLLETAHQAIVDKEPATSQSEPKPDEDVEKREENSKPTDSAPVIKELQISETTDQQEAIDIIENEKIGERFTEEHHDIRKRRETMVPSALIETIALEDALGDSERLKKKKTHRKLLSQSFKEFYRGLILLESYCNLNVEALEKILKKHDKNTGVVCRDRYREIISKKEFYSHAQLKLLISETEVNLIFLYISLYYFRFFMPLPFKMVIEQKLWRNFGNSF